MNSHNDEHAILEHAREHALLKDAVNELSENELRHIARLITMGELSACFAHEVFNPLMVIRGHLRFIDEGLVPDHPLRTSLEVIERTTRRLEEMAKRMLDFSRKQASPAELCDPAELVADALKFVQPHIHGHQVDIQTDCDKGVPSLEVDRLQLVQALVNLIQNATDAMAKSEHRVLRLSVVFDKGNTRISVSDTGSGIPPDDLPQIFNPFFTTKGDRGSGLGLYIAKRAIQEHGGSIDVQTGSRGTTFVMSFPGR